MKLTLASLLEVKIKANITTQPERTEALIKIDTDPTGCSSHPDHITATKPLGASYLSHTKKGLAGVKWERKAL